MAFLSEALLEGMNPQQGNSLIIINWKIMIFRAEKNGYQLLTLKHHTYYIFSRQLNTPSFTVVAMLYGLKKSDLSVLTAL